MNTSERIYQSVRNLTEVQAEAVLRFIDYLRFKQPASTVSTTERKELRKLLKTYPIRNRSSVEIDAQIQSLRNEWD